MDRMIFYYVTRGSSDGTIKEGDLIYLSNEDLLVICNAGGFLLKDEWDSSGTNDFSCVSTNQKNIKKEVLTKLMERVKDGL